MRRQLSGLLFVSIALLAFGCGPAEDDDPLVVDPDSSGLRAPPDDDESDDGGGNGGGDTGVEDTYEPDTGVDDAGADGGPDDATNDPPEDTGGGDQDATSPNVDEVDPMCIDGEYSEPLPDDDADISTAKQNYSENDVKGFVRTALDKRYSVGKWLVNNALEEGRQDCVEQFLRDTSGPDAVLRGLSTVVHECGHIFDFNVSPHGGSTYKITPDVSFSCSGGDTTARGGNTFPRSELLNDEYQSEHPACDSRGERGCDSYALIYLEGQGSDQGFNSVLEETTQYVNSLATSYAFRDAYPSRRATSGLDGILTFLWYVERYLRMARTQYPDAYAHLKESDCWRRAILTVWGRAWLMIDAAKQYDRLGINEEKLFDLVRTPELLQEIERIRTAHGCQ